MLLLDPEPSLPFAPVPKAKSLPSAIATRVWPAPAATATAAPPRFTPPCSDGSLDGASPTDKVEPSPSLP